MSAIEDLFQQYRKLTADSNAAAMLVLAHIQLGAKPDDALLTTKQAAEQLGVSAETVRSLCRDGQIQSIRVGRKLRLRPAWVAEYLRSGGTGITLTALSRH